MLRVDCEDDRLGATDVQDQPTVQALLRDDLRVAKERTAGPRGGRAHWQAAILKHTFPLAAAFAARYLDVRSDTVAHSVDRIDATLDAVAQTLRDGRPYLAGDAFSAADLTFAAMSAPFVLPARYGVTLPTAEVIPEDTREHVARWMRHPAGVFAARLYEERPVPRGRYKRAMQVAPRERGFPA